MKKQPRSKAWMERVIFRALHQRYPALRSARIEREDPGKNHQVVCRLKPNSPTSSELLHMEAAHALEQLRSRYLIVADDSAGYEACTEACGHAVANGKDATRHKSSRTILEVENIITLKLRQLHPDVERVRIDHSQTGWRCSHVWKVTSSPTRSADDKLLAEANTMLAHVQNYFDIQANGDRRGVSDGGFDATSTPGSATI